MQVCKVSNIDDISTFRSALQITRFSEIPITPIYFTCFMSADAMSCLPFPLLFGLKTAIDQSMQKYSHVWSKVLVNRR